MKRFAVSCVAVFLFLLSAGAELAWYDPISYTPGTDLDASADWTDNGAIDNMVVSGTLSYPGLAVSTGSMVRMDAVVDAVQANTRVSTITSGVAYLSLLLRVDNIGTLSTNAVTDRALLATYSTAVKNNMIGLLKSTSDSARFTVGCGYSMTDANNQWADNAGAGYATGTVFLLVLKNDDVVTGSLTNLHLWINPSSSTFGENDPGSPDLTARSRGGASFHVNLKTGMGADVVIDEIRVGTTWADVTPTSLSKGTVIITR